MWEIVTRLREAVNSYVALIVPEDFRNDPNPIQAITQRFTTALERIIRTAPTRYFWLHRRWKHQPAKPARQVA